MTNHPQCRAPVVDPRDFARVAQAVCLWRRTLMACTEMNRVIAVSMSRRLGVETTVAHGLVNRLEKEGYVKAPGKGKK